MECRRDYEIRERYVVGGILETAKREEVVGTFKEEKFELLALPETKLKGTGELS